MEIIRFENINALRERIFANGLEQYVLVQIDDRKVELDDNFELRITQVAQDCDAAMAYSYYRERLADGSVVNHPLSDYQYGSLRDDFDFGPLVLLNVSDVLAATEDFDEDLTDPDGGWYALRLRLSVAHSLVGIPEYLYTVEKVDYRKSGEKQHDYVDPRRRDYQQHMERILTTHLYEINALVPAKRRTLDFFREDFPVEMSVVIPVRNRVNTIADAVNSALMQKPGVSFNVIVVDNGSTDGTLEYLQSVSDPRLRLISLTGKENLGIGGCWNRAVLSEHCGRFAVQLDSDDLYADDSTLKKIRDKFLETGAAMVIGSYLMTDFDLNVIPPGLINHSEWTDENGANNALRINGLGAPRAFFTPVLRSILFPNVSYGEDYAVALRICREFMIGRIYDPIYFCRRWAGNSDAALSVEKVNANNSYKDFVRTVEMIARININREEDELLISAANNLYNDDELPFSDEDFDEEDDEFYDDEEDEDDSF